MKEKNRKIQIRLLIALLLAIILIILAFVPLLAASQQPDVITTNVTETHLLQSSIFDIAIDVETESSATGETVKNGDWVIYTVRVTNLVPIPRTITRIFLDTIPAGLTELECESVDCAIKEETKIQPIFAPGSNIDEDAKVTELDVITITETSEISTTTSQTLSPGASVEFKFRAIFNSCDPAGAKLKITAKVNVGDSTPLSEESKATIITVDESGNPSQGNQFFDNVPSGCSAEQGGVYDQDWGDYDRDGDLDLALATLSGLSVYENESGQLVRKITSPDKQLFSVRWGDLDDDRYLELVAVGHSTPDRSTDVSNISSYKGKNYIIDLDPNSSSFNETPFDTPEVIWQIALADLDDNNKVDKIAAANYFDPRRERRPFHNLCLLRVYEVDNTGTVQTNTPCAIGPLPEKGIPWGGDNTIDLDWNDVIFPSQLAIGNNGSLNQLYSFNTETNEFDPPDSWGRNNTQAIAWVEQEGNGNPDLLEVSLQDTRIYTGPAYDDTAPITTSWVVTLPTGYEYTEAAWTAAESLDASIPPADSDVLKYSLPETFNYFNLAAEAICVNTNGVVEFILATGDCREDFSYNNPAPTPTDGINAIYALSNSALKSGVIIEALPGPRPVDIERIEITWIGTNGSNFEEQQLLFKVIIYKEGEIEWRFFDVPTSAESEDYFTGLHYTENNETIEKKVGGPEDPTRSKTAYLAELPETLIANITWPFTYTAGPFSITFTIDIDNNSPELVTDPPDPTEPPEPIDLAASEVITSDIKLTGPYPFTGFFSHTGNIILNDQNVTITFSQIYNTPNPDNTKPRVSMPIEINLNATIQLSGSITVTKGMTTKSERLIMAPEEFNQTKAITRTFNTIKDNEVRTTKDITLTIENQFQKDFPFVFGELITKTVEWNVNNHWRSIPTSDDDCLGGPSICDLYNLPFTFTSQYHNNLTVNQIHVNTNGLVQFNSNTEGTEYYIYQANPNIDAIYAPQGDLKTGVIIDYHDVISKMVGISWVGTAFGEDYQQNPVMIKVNLFSNGQIQWKIFNINTDRELFAGFQSSRCFYIFSICYDIPVQLSIPGGVPKGPNLNKLYQNDTATDIIRLVSRARALALGLSGSNDDQIYFNRRSDDSLRKSPSDYLDKTSSCAGDTNRMAWADYNGDSNVDLAVARDGGICIYEASSENRLHSSPSGDISIPDVKDLAWSDIDGDNDPDLILGINGQSQTYINDGNGTLESGQTLTASHNTRSIALGDIDGDNDADLAVGINGNNIIYRNNNGTFDQPMWTADEADNTKTLLWADVDNDKDLDLIVGNDGENRLYLNRQRFSYPVSDTNRNLGWINTVAWNGDQLGIGGQDLLPPDKSQDPGGAFSYVLKNGATASSPFIISNVVSLPVNPPVDSEVYRMEWGDFNDDDSLDLVATYPTANQVRIYRADGSGGFELHQTLAEVEAYGVDWADLNSDGQLDLIITIKGEEPRVYFNNNNSFFADNPIKIEVPGPAESWFVSVRAIDFDNDGDLDLFFSNLKGQSLLYSNNSTVLDQELSIKATNHRGDSIAWGDINGDNDLELLIGGIDETMFGWEENSDITKAKLFDITDGVVSQIKEFDNIHTPVTFGDINGDGRLDIAGFDAQNLRVRFLISNSTNFSETTATDLAIVNDIAFGDSDGDEVLDLLGVGRIGFNIPHYLFTGFADGTFRTDPDQFSYPYEDPSTSVAWADFNKDGNLDFAVANYGQPVRVFRGNGDNSFDFAWGGPTSLGMSVDWADYDQDGWLDLALGNYIQKNIIYRNQNGNSFTEVWSSPDAYSTRVVAWGDLNQDGKPDLAVGNFGRADQIFVNRSTPGTVAFDLEWVSTQEYNTTDLAWGDFDNDSDLDLAASHSGTSESSGVYLNNFTLKSGLLPQSQTTVTLARPGNTHDAFFFSSRAITTTNGITLSFTLNGMLPKDGIKFEYLAFGNEASGVWEEIEEPGSLSNPLNSGVNTTVWNPPDELVSDEIYFRATIIDHSAAGPWQRTRSQAVSPPFRTIAGNCDYPKGPSFTVKPQPIREPNQDVEFKGFIEDGTDLMFYSWDFGDNSTGTGQLAFHTYNEKGIYTITLTIINQRDIDTAGCQSTRRVIASKVITVGNIQLPPPADPPDPPAPPPNTNTNLLTYLPLIFGADGASTSIRTMGVSITGGPTPNQIVGLQGSTNANAVTLSWDARPLEEGVVGYKIYHRPRSDGPGQFYELGDVPANITNYTHGAGCGQMYFITAYNANGESLPSVASYFSRSCS